MSPTARPASSTTTPTTSLVNADDLLPNPWNPNRMTGAMYEKARESIETYGFIDPLTVREIGYDKYQIIDGEHRFNVGREIGMTEFPCVNLGLIDDARAKKLTIILNELHGQADPDRMGTLLQDILDDTSLDDLLVALPYDEAILSGFLGRELPDLTPLKSGPPPTSGESTDKIAWVERLYRLPKDAALVVDEALEKAADGEKVDQWQALERVCADYLAT